MGEKCTLHKILEQLTTVDAGGGQSRSPARAILNIIADIEQDGVRARDIHYLADLVRELEETGSVDEMLAYLGSDAHDCHVCAALAQHIKTA